MRIAVVLTVAVIANSIGSVCLSKGMKQFEAAASWSLGEFVQLGWHAISNPWVVVGVVLLMIFLASYLTALSWADLSFVLPATAPAYILTAGMSKVFLNETISPARWAGTFLIVVGTCLVARTHTARATSRPDHPAPASAQGLAEAAALETRASGRPGVD